MRSYILAGLVWAVAVGDGAIGQVKLIVVEPGHFHAALIQKDMYPQISPRVSVYAPLGPELLEYLNRVQLFNSRAEDPTRWELEVHTGAGFFDRMLAEHAGNVVVFAGRNREKLGRIARSLAGGYNVLADKPWVIASADLPALAAALGLAGKKGLVAYDIMTERYEIASILQKEIVNSPKVFGELSSGSEAEPAIQARSIHYLMKTVAGVPLRRPAWFLNIDETGEGLADVGTHVVDLVQWVAFPGQQIDYRTDVQIGSARRWPTMVSQGGFADLTGQAGFPPELKRWVKGGELEYYSNHIVHYKVRGVHVALDIRWLWEAPAGAGDLYEATFRGSRARTEIRQGAGPNSHPELYIVPNTSALSGEAAAALREKVRTWRKEWPGVDLEIRGGEAHIAVPDKYRVGHEAHFAQVTRAFLQYLKDPGSLPAWEQSNMLVKYYISTKGVELSRGRGRE